MSYNQGAVTITEDSGSSLDRDAELRFIGRGQENLGGSPKATIAIRREGRLKVTREECFFRSGPFSACTALLTILIRVLWRSSLSQLSS